MIKMKSLEFWNWDFGFVSDFDIRILNLKKEGGEMNGNNT
jgi:hypothetical protein